LAIADPDATVVAGGPDAVTDVERAKLGAGQTSSETAGVVDAALRRLIELVDLIPGRGDQQ
jgi:hypothetical protein